LRTALRVVAYVSFGFVMLVVWYAILSSLTVKLSVVGSNLVNVEWPPSSVSPIYLQPITVLYVSFLAFLYSELELNKKRIMALPDSVKTLSKFAGFMVAVIFFYEICYNFVLWSGEIAAATIEGNLNPFYLVNKFPALSVPWNLVFATKLWSVFFLAGAYVFWFFNRLEDRTVVGNTVSGLTRQTTASTGVSFPRLIR
jgi:hypothetical protein